MSDKIFELDALTQELARRRKGGERIVQCHGCFDIVHPGHIRYLRFARSLGDRLVVTVSADEVVGKGEQRPYIPEQLRLENLAALEFVDFVCLSRDAWAGPVLETLRPDVYVKGKEYETSRDPRFASEKQLVEGYGGEVVFGSGHVVFSSTEIIARHGARWGLEPAKVRAFCHAHGIDSVTIASLLDRFADRTVVVLGDPILDRYVHCEEASVASEGPILDVTPVAEDWYAGGGALVARQLAALGARVRFLTVGTPGDDLARLRAGLEHAGVEPICVEVEARPVYVKTRYLVAHQKLFKVNQGVPNPISSGAVTELVTKLDAELAECDGLVATDFGYGMFGESLCEAIAASCRTHGRRLYADVSSNGRANVLKFHNPRLATPTERELRFALADTESGLASLALRYYQTSGAEQLIVTLGRRGAIYFHPPRPDETRLRTDYLPSLETTAWDAVGAGDVFMAGATLADLCDAPMPHGMYLASALSALAIGRVGNDPADFAELRAYLEMRPDF